MLAYKQWLFFYVSAPPGHDSVTVRQHGSAIIPSVTYTYELAAVTCQNVLYENSLTQSEVYDMT